MTVAFWKKRTSATLAERRYKDTMIDSELLKILCCPETHQGISLADPSLVEKLNQQIAAGKLQNRAGQPLTERIDGGLVRDDGKFVYPIRQDIPVMLIDEAIPLAA